MSEFEPTMSDAMKKANSLAPKVTIGMPVYNGQMYLAETIDSVLAQTFTDFELVICDNASTDTTGDICRKYASTDSRIRYFRNETNIGSVLNHRRTLDLARGKYFRWGSANDLCRPALLERCVAVLDSNPGVAVAFGLTTIIDDDGREVSEYDRHLHLVDKNPADRFIRYVKEVGYINQFAGLVRTDAMRRAKPLGDYIASDIVLLAELTLQGEFFEIQEPLFKRRMTLTASTQGKSLAQLKVFYNPYKPNRIVLPVWRQQWELQRALYRSNIPSGEKSRAAWFVIRCYFWRRRQLIAEIGSAFGQILGRS